MKRILTMVILGLTITTVFAQPWVKGGNNGVPPGSQPIIGTDATWNAPLLFHTNGIQRQIIQNGGTTSANGRIAMGNNLAIGFIPRSRLHLHHDDVSNISLRFTNSSTGTGNGDGFIVGYRAISAITNRQFAEMNNFENTAMKFWTNNTQRMHINASVQSNINGYTILVPGFVGIGGNTGNIWGDQNNVGTGPFSLLHLNDVFGNLSAEQRGYRPWMQTGISYTTNEDFAYVGYRSFTDDNTATGNRSLNRNEFNIAWSNNEITSASGSDDMAFRFTNRVDGANGMPNVIDATNLNSAEDLDGRHIARFTAIGNMGLGATFGEDHPVYVKPQSLLHMSKTDTSDTWLQVTNQTGTGQTAADGLRIGITTTGTAHIRQQENLPLIFYTGSTEDARIIPTSASTLPLSNHGMVGIGNWATATNITNPINAKLDIDGDLRIRTVTQRDTLTRVLVIDSADKNRVHWRSVASLVGNVTANNGVSVNATTSAVQLGVPCQDSLGNNNLPEIIANAFTEDRVVAIGDFNLWFATYAGDKGGVGIGGQPASTPFCGTGNTLEISANGASKYGAASSSGLRFTHLTSDSLTVPVGTNGVVDTKVLTVDQDGDVVLVDAVGGGNVTADNGLSIDPLNANNVQLGNDVGLTTAQLISDREIPMNDNNLFFSDPSSQVLFKNRIEIGNNNVSFLTFKEFNKLSVVNGESNPFPARLGGYFSTSHNYSPYSSGIPLIFNTYYFGNVTPVHKIGIMGIAADTNNPVGSRYIGISGGAYGNNSSNNIGVSGKSYGNSNIYNTGVYAAAGSNDNTTRNTGLVALANFGTIAYGVNAYAAAGSVNYGVWASSPVTGTNRAGIFDGDLEYTGALINSSDKMFKINVANIEKATDLLRKLKPHTYNMDITNFPQFNFQNRLQYGFIAQEVADVLPNLVHESYMPSELDSLGNEISPAVSYKSLNYNAFIPITVQAVNELNSRLDNSTLSDQNVKTNVQNLANSLDKVKQMRGVSYEWSSSAQNDMNLDSLQHIGFIAQEIAAIEPLLTFTDDSSLVHVNYDRVASLLVESVKELDDKILAKDSIINYLQDEINTIKECLLNSNICIEGNRTMNTEPDNNTNYKSIELTNVNSIILNQNLPNPFKENTVINYNIPAEVSEAKLLFYDLNGRIIKELIIEERGESKLTVYGANLKTGVYTYSLIADGELIATKKMVKK